MILVIPTFSDPNYRQTTFFEGTAYVLEFSYNQRELVWYLSVSDPDGTPLANGMKVMANIGLLGSRTDVRLPPGEIVAVTTSADDSPPDIGELGDGLRCTLIYLDSTEGRRL